MTLTSNVRNWYQRVNSFIPNWMTNRPGFQVFAKTIFTFALMCDRATQVAIEGARAGMPGYDSRTDNLQLIGASRSLIQGEAETQADFVVRLQRWLDTAQQMGSDVDLASQIHLWLANAPMVRIWTRNGRCTTCGAGTFTVTKGSASVTASSSQTGIMTAGQLIYFSAQPAAIYKLATVAGTALTLTAPYTGQSSAVSSGAVQVARVAGGWTGPGPLSGFGLNWDSVSNPERAEWWWNSWIIVYPSEFPSAGTIGGRLKPDGTPDSNSPASAVQGLGIGHLCTRVQVDTILWLVAQRKGQHAAIPWIIWAPVNSPLFDPANMGQAGNPDGKWGSWAYWGPDPLGVGATGNWPHLNQTCRYWGSGLGYT